MSLHPRIYFLKKNYKTPPSPKLVMIQNGNVTDVLICYFQIFKYLKINKQKIISLKNGYNSVPFFIFQSALNR